MEREGAERSVAGVMGSRHAFTSACCRQPLHPESSATHLLLQTRAAVRGVQRDPCCESASVLGRGPLEIAGRGDQRACGAKKKERLLHRAGF